jgi:hypothetical protein
MLLGRVAMTKLTETDWEMLFPHHPPESICLECGRRFDDVSHLLSTGESCHFTLNTEENRLLRAETEIRRLIDRGMTVEDLSRAVVQVSERRASELVEGRRLIVLQELDVKPEEMTCYKCVGTRLVADCSAEQIARWSRGSRSPCTKTICASAWDGYNTNGDCLESK